MNSHRRIAAGCLMTTLLCGCGADSSEDKDVKGSQATASADAGAESESSVKHYYPTSSVVFSDEGQSTYVSLLESLAKQDVDLDRAREFAGWADLWVHGGAVFLTDGEGPALTRYSVTETGKLVGAGRLSFLDYGAESAAFWRNVLISPTKAYLFIPEAREVVTWDPTRLEITGSFELPELADREGQLLYVTTDRGTALRGERLYVTAGWGDWGNYSLANDSAILVIDTATDAIVETLPVPCPDLNVATLDDQGNMYFSNWVYGIGPALFEGGNSSCAVRIKEGEEQLDTEWALTFSDVTGGREAAALRFLGDGKALLSVFHDERVELTPESDRYAVVDSPNWKFWTLDLETLAAEPVTGISWHSGGYYGARIDERNLLFVPSGDYASTEALELFADGSVETRWTATGWTTRLFKLR